VYVKMENNNGFESKLTPEQREKLRKIQEEDRKTSKYVALATGENLDILFDLSRISKGEREFKGNKTKVFTHMVKVPAWNGANPEEKEFRLSPKFARKLWNTISTSGRLLINVSRTGATANDTDYTFTPK
jgi:hypothetical protein